MQSPIKVNIQNAEQVFNANTIHNTKYYSGGRLLSETQRRSTGQSSQSQDPGFDGSLIPDGSLGSSPPRTDSFPVHQNDEADLPTSVQASSSSGDEERLPGTAVQDNREQEEQRFRTPVAAEASADYISVGREYDGGELNGAAPADPTAMAELKTSFPEYNSNTAEEQAYGETPGSSAQSCDEDTDLKRRTGDGQESGAPLRNHDGAANHSPHYVTEWEPTAQNEDTYPDLDVDGPEQTSLDRHSGAENAASVSPVLSGSNAGQTVTPKSDAAVAQRELDIGDRQDSTKSADLTENNRESDNPEGEDDRLSLTAGSGNLENAPPQQVPGRFESEAEEERPPTLRHGLDPRSLEMDGGGGGEDKFVFLYRKMLIQDDGDPVSVVEMSPCLKVLQEGENDGALPGGPSQLAQLTWRGHRDFVLSQWKITLDPQTSRPDQTADFIRHVCGILLDLDILCVRAVVKQLNQGHNIFLHSLCWDGGLLIVLGHTNPVVREKCLALPEKEAVRNVLQQLVADCRVALDCQDPTPLDDEDDAEDRRPPDMPEEESQVSSVSSSDLFGSGQTARRREDAVNLPSQQPRPVGNRLPESGQNGASSSTASSLMRLLDDIVEEKCCSLMDERKSRLESGEKQQLEQLECERKKLEEKVLELQCDLEKCQSANLSLSQKQAQTEERQADMMELMSQMRRHLQAQDETIGEMKRTAEMSEERQEERKAAEEERKQQVNKIEEDLKVMEETSSNRHQAMTEHLEGLQQEIRQQKERQDELFTMVEEHGEIVHRVRTGLPEVVSLVVGAVQEEEEEAEGAVGGQLSSRNRYSSALEESEKTTSKMKGKDEEIGSNQIEDKIRPMGATVSSFGQMSEVPQMKTSDSFGQLVELPGGVPAGPKGGPGTEERPRTTGIVSAQGGARNKTIQKPPEKDSAARESSPLLSGRKQTSRESSQDRTTGLTNSEESEEDFTKAEQFLEWVQFSAGPKEQRKTMIRHVSAALKEEAVPAPRAKCLDTILCIDVSDSIVTDGLLETVKNTAMDFVDGIEDLMNENDMEENIAVVAMGGHARVVQHLTNDLTLVREAIESLDCSGGRSPFVQALMVCLAANKSRGGIVNVAGVYKVPPRVIFITDGCPTDEGQEAGPDLPSNINQTKFDLVNLLSQFASCKRKSIPRSISWVPVGHDADKQFLDSLANLSDGALVMPGDIRNLCRHYKLQQTIGRLLKMVKNQGDNVVPDDKVRELLEAMTADTINAQEKKNVVETVQKLHQSPEEEEEPQADDFNRVFEDEVKVKNGELLALGTRVVRGPDWKWKNQDTDGPGTVILHSKKDNWIYIKWDNGTHNAYRYGEEGQTDVVETQHHPRQIAPDSDKLDFGVRVARGPDWQGENEDRGGPGSVIRWRKSDGKVKVRWDITGKIHEYNYNSTRGREVQIILPEFPRRGDNGRHGKGHKSEHDADKTIAMWKWRDERRQLRLYDEATRCKLEAEYKKRPGASCIIARAGVDRRVSFKLMQEKAVDGGAYTEVTREMVDEERKNDLLAIEMSLQE